MPYALQTIDGKILALSDSPQSLTAIWLDDDDPRVVQFINSRRFAEDAKATLEHSDLELIRVIEDLTELLIKKQVFTFTELPEFVQHKLGKRQKMRSDMVSLAPLLNDENDQDLF